MKIKIAALVLLTALFTGCTSVQVRPVEASKYPIKMVYIQQNPNVAVEDFLRVVDDAFQRHGIETKIITGEPPTESAYLLTYTAKRGWDLTFYLKHAELRLKQGTKQVATATYHHRAWFGLNKYAGTQSKMNPVIDQLLAEFPSH